MSPSNQNHYWDSFNGCLLSVLSIVFISTNETVYMVSQKQRFTQFNMPLISISEIWHV